MKEARDCEIQVTLMAMLRIEIQLVCLSDHPQLDVMVHACNSSNREAEAGGLQIQVELGHTVSSISKQPGLGEDRGREGEGRGRERGGRERNNLIKPICFMKYKTRAPSHTNAGYSLALVIQHLVANTHLEVLLWGFCSHS